MLKTLVNLMHRKLKEYYFKHLVCEISELNINYNEIVFVCNVNSNIVHKEKLISSIFQEKIEFDRINVELRESTMC